MQRLLKLAQARNLDRIAVAYAVAGWVLVQGAAIIFPAFDAPAWALRAFIIAVLVGFPAALTVAWFATPHSDAIDEKTGGISHREIVLLALLGVVLLLSVGELVFVIRRPPPAPALAAAGPAQASIAVVPFINMSGDPAREIVSDGISEELLDDLSNNPALRVAAHTSSFAFKGKNEDVRQIAHLLDVRTVVEGSIREDGTHIRIAAQLINADNGYGLWSASYDRDMTGILTLEDEIARAITGALTNRLLGAADLAGKPSVIDPVAYRKYLEGQHAFAPRTADGVAKAVALFEDVTAMQPDFADGFAALGRALINHAEFHPEQKDLMPRAQAALARALALDPDNINALAAHLDLALHRLDWKTAYADAKRLKAINPGNYAVLHELFRYYQLLGFPDLALSTVRSAAGLDPLSFVDRYNVMAALIHNGQYPEVIDAAPAALRLQPNQTEALAMLCTADTHSNRLPDGHAILLQLMQTSDETSRAGCEFDIDVAEGRPSEARKIVDALASQFPHGDFGAADIGQSYAEAGDFKAALAWLARSYSGREFELFTIPYTHSIPAAFFRDPQWKALLQRPLFRDWQSEHDYLAAEFATAH
jgi:TolB-like protein